MLGGVDAIKRTLKIPPRFVPYMEKHRIYELCYELGTELVIKQPGDHISYLKQCLRHAALNRDTPRIIILAPSDFDKLRLAEALHDELGVRPVTLADIHKVTSTCMDIRCAEAEDLARNLKKILRTGMLHDSGWVLVDIPRTKAEAQAFQRIGIIPTHVLLINPSGALDCAVAEEAGTDFRVPMQNHNGSGLNAEQRAYQKHLSGMRMAYSNSIIEIDVGDRSIEELGKDCAVLAKMRKHCGAPSLFRVAIIGARGSGSRTVARELCARFHLVHVDFEKILRQARMQDSSLGTTLRMIEHTWGKRPTPEMRVQVVEKFILGYECMKRGWVLTGFPITEQDFRLLDMLATPPNRVIFLEVDSFTCRHRVLGRRVNMYTGSKHNLTSDELSDNIMDELAAHPEDYRSNVERQIKEYEDNVAAMMNYAGASASVIDGSGSQSMVRELVEACLIRPAPCASARVPTEPPDIQVEDIEFEPDAEVDPRVFDGIRLPEATMSLV